MKKRQAIIQRQAICNPELRKIKKCTSCCVFSNLDLGKSSYLITSDCCNNKFIYFNKLSHSSKRAIKHYLNSNNEVPYAYINVNLINNLDYILWIITEFSGRNLPVYIETSVDLPNSILSELSKNPFNVIQCNLNQVSDYKYEYASEESYKTIEKLRELPYKAKINGIYTIISINPIIPTITKIKNILTILESEKYNYNHLILKFISIPKKLNTLEYVQVDNIKIDSDYFILRNNIWECADWYKEVVKKIIKYFIKDVTFCICDEKSNCRGIDIKVSSKDEDSLFFFKSK